MGLLRGNPLAGQIEGMIGELVIANHKPGVKVVRKRPVRSAPATEGELANQAKLRGAIAWAKDVWAKNPQLKEKYVSAGRPQFRRGFDLAKADFLRPPSVEDIDLSGYTGRSGDLIRVRAADDFAVHGVEVVIRKLDGTVVEEGAATPENGPWVYTAKAEVPAGETVEVEVTAMDNPGHTAVKKVDHACGPRG